MLQVFVLIKIFGVYQLYLSGLFSGLNVIFFWIPYNAMHFKFSHEDNHGLHSGMYYLITPILGITLQPLTGIVAEKFGFFTVFLILVSLTFVQLVDLFSGNDVSSKLLFYSDIHFIFCEDPAPVRQLFRFSGSDDRRGFDHQRPYLR